MEAIYKKELVVLVVGRYFKFSAVFTELKESAFIFSGEQYCKNSFF